MKKIAAILVAAMLSISVSACSPSSAQTEASASASVSVAAPKAAEAKKTREAEEKARKEAAEKLDTAKSTLNDKVSQARSLLDSSNNNVADPQTRVALSDAINADSVLESTDPETYTQAIQPLQSAMDGVNASVDRKKQDDAAAA
jgi:negative regulator of replication initiation